MYVANYDCATHLRFRTGYLRTSSDKEGTGAQASGLHRHVQFVPPTASETLALQSALVKQMMYRVSIPVCQARRDDVSPRCTQQLFSDRVRDRQCSHARAASCFDSGRRVFDNQTLTWKQRKISIDTPRFVQRLQRKIISIRRGFVFETRAGADN